MFIQEGRDITLRSRGALMRVLAHFEETDKWFILEARSIEAMGLNDFPLPCVDPEKKAKIKDAFLNAGGTAEDCAAAFKTAVEDSGIFLEFPTGEIYGLRPTSCASVYARAGWGSAKNVASYEKRPHFTPFPAEKRAEWMTAGLSASSEEIKVLVTDGMVGFAGSSRYVILPYREGIEATEKALCSVFGQYEYGTGRMSHDYLMVQYRVASPETEAHRMTLYRCGALPAGEPVEYVLRFSSSNTGRSEMRARMLAKARGALIPIGHPQGVWHDTTRGRETRELTPGDHDGCTVAAFEYKLEHFLGASLRESEDLVEEWGNTALEHPIPFLKNLLAACPSIPAGPKKDAVDTAETEWRDKNVTAVEAYIAAARAAGHVSSLGASISAMEEVALLLAKKIPALDTPGK